VVGKIIKIPDFKQCRTHGTWDYVGIKNKSQVTKVGIIPHETFEDKRFHQKDRNKKGKKNLKIRDIKFERNRYDGIGKTQDGEEKKTWNYEDPRPICPFHENSLKNERFGTSGIIYPDKPGQPRIELYLYYYPMISPLMPPLSTNNVNRRGSLLFYLPSPLLHLSE
jgi:hypothetical protein